MTQQPILITGGTGFLGRALAFYCLERQQAVAVLGRSGEKITRMFGQRVQAFSRIADLPDAGEFKAVINLAGAGMIDRRWSVARKRVLRDSRIGLTQDLVDWIAHSNGKPQVLISGSAIGVYGDQADAELSEQSPFKPDFAQTLCEDWETAALAAEQAGVRVCLLRTGLVLGREGGLLQRMLWPFRLGLGGRLGNGKQWMSWIHIDDWLAAVFCLLNNPGMQGAYNLTAPAPVTNRLFSETLAAILKRPLLLPLPAPLLKRLLGEMAGLVLGSQRVKPQRLLQQGFRFQFTGLDAALRDLLNS